MSEGSLLSRPVGAVIRRVERWRSMAPADLIAALAVIAIVAFDLWVLRAERLYVTTPNDTNIHASMVDWATGQFRSGRIPFDGWFPVSSLGAARFHQYQSLPHLLVSAVQFLTGLTGLVSWALYLLLALWPIAVYASSRLFGLEHRQAAFAAVLAPLLGGLSSRGFQWESYIFSGTGLWAMAWGMWLLPFAWATSWRAVSGRGSIVVASLVLGLTIPTHLLVGYLAVLSVPLWILIAPREFVPRLTRSVLLGVGTVAASAWFLLPFLADRAFIPHAEIYEGKAQFDSFGFEGLTFLVRGLVFDVADRAPILTIIVGWGLWRTSVGSRADEHRRAILAVFLLSLLLFTGRAALGPIIGLLPGGQDLFLNRFMIGVHMAGLFMAGIGSETFTRLPRLERRSGAPMGLGSLGPVVVSLIVALALLGPIGDRRHVAEASGARIGEQVRADAVYGQSLNRLLDLVVEPGRIFTGFTPATLQAWDRADDPVALVARYGTVNLNYQISRLGEDIIGFPRPAWSLMSVQEGRFDDADPGHFQLFGARYALLAASEQPKVPATRLSEDRGLVLWEIEGAPTYLRVVQTDGPAILTNRDRIGSQGAAVLSTSGPRDGVYRPMGFAGRPAPVPTGIDPGFSGQVLTVAARPADGVFSGTVRASGPADVVLSASYDPRWEVTVDGTARPVEMLAPALPAVRVGAGEHQIQFRYIPVGGYWLRFAFGVLLLFGVRYAAGRWADGSPRTGAEPIGVPSPQRGGTTREVSAEGSPGGETNRPPLPSKRRKKKRGGRR